MRMFTLRGEEKEHWAQITALEETVNLPACGQQTLKREGRELDIDVGPGEEISGEVDALDRLGDAESGDRSVARGGSNIPQSQALGLTVDLS